MINIVKISISIFRIYSLQSKINVMIHMKEFQHIFPRYKFMDARSKGRVESSILKKLHKLTEMSSGNEIDKPVEARDRRYSC